MRFRSDIFSEKLENRGYPVINHLEAYGYDEYYLTNRSITSLELEHRINKKAYWNILSAFNFYQRDKVTYLKDLTKNNNNMSVVPNPNANSSTSFLNFMSRGTYSNAFRNFINYQVGYDINLNNAYGTRIEAEKGRMNDYALFACAEFRLFRSMKLKPGFRATYNTRYSAPFIPSAQLMYTGIRNLTLRYAYGRGFRAPSLKELYLYFVDYNHTIIGNPDLRSEISDNHNFALRYKLKVNKEFNIFLDNSYYHNQIYDQIALVAVNPINIEYTYGNVDNFRSMGTNFNATGMYQGWRVTLGASYMGIYNSAFREAGTKNNQWSPEARAQIGYTFSKTKLSGTTLSLFHKYNGKLYGYALDNLRNVVSTYTDDFHILDFTANRQFWDSKISATAGIKNLLNITTINSSNVAASYHGSSSTSMPVSVGRSYFLQLNIKI
jgi:outer membrane receptor for ferrienterochelin and colicins